MKSPKDNGSSGTPAGKGRKPTALEMEARITEVEMLWSLGARRTQVHAAMSAKHQVDWRTTDRYLSRAKANLAKRHGKSKEEHRKDSYDFYQAIALNASASAGARIRARQRVDELFGLDAPKHVELTGKDGQQLAPVAMGSVIITIPDNGRDKAPISQNGNGANGHGLEDRTAGKAG